MWQSTAWSGFFMAIEQQLRSLSQTPLSMQRQNFSKVSVVKTKRNVTIDILRGYCIIMMITSHISPNSLVNQCVHFQRFISGAEGFVFLSGLVLGLVYRRKLDAFSAVQSYVKIWKRALMIWAVHCIIVLGALVSNIWVFHFSDIPDIRSLGVFHSIWLTITLQMQPGHMLNILPMYVVLLGIAPLVFEMLRRRKTGLLVFISVSLFLYTQVNPAFLTWGDPNLGGIAFPPVMWQVLFIAGMCIGYHSNLIRTTILDRNRRALTWLLGGLVLLMMVITLFHTPHFAFYNHTKWDLFLWQREPLRFGRVLYFMLSVSFFYLLVQRLHNLSFTRRVMNALSLLGRNSLYSFIVHLGFAFMVGMLMMIATDRVSLELSPVFTVLMVYFMAKYQVGRKFIPN